MMTEKVTHVEHSTTTTSNEPLAPTTQTQETTSTNTTTTTQTNPQPINVNVAPGDTVPGIVSVNVPDGGGGSTQVNING